MCVYVVRVCVWMQVVSVRGWGSVGGRGPGGEKWVRSMQVSASGKHWLAVLHHLCMALAMAVDVLLCSSGLLISSWRASFDCGF